VSLLRPTWKWDFARNGLPGGYTYTGSGGTYFNSAGTLVSATTNVPRFDYDPVTLSPLGYLAEMQSTNLALYSNTLGTGWTLDHITLGTGVTGPDGVAGSLLKLAEDNTTNSHRFYRGFTVSSGVSHTLSVFAQAGERTTISLGDASTANVSATFDLTTGAASSVGSAVTSTNARRITSNIWRLSIQYVTGTTTATAVVSLIKSGSSSYLGTTGEGAYVGFVQLEGGGVGVTSYIPTAGSTASRTQDVLSLPLTSLPGWDATKGGVLVAAYRLHTLNPSVPGYGQHPATLWSGSANNMVAPFRSTSDGTMRAYFTSGGSDQIYQSVGSAPAVFTRSKMATLWGAARGGGAADGSAFAGANGSFSLPVGLTYLDLGRYADRNINGTLESIAYYKGARSDAFVQAVSR
jgi:hypothetical protein